MTWLGKSIPYFTTTSLKKPRGQQKVREDPQETDMEIFFFPFFNSCSEFQELRDLLEKILLLQSKVFNGDAFLWHV